MIHDLFYRVVPAVENHYSVCMAQNGNDQKDPDQNPRPFMNWRLLVPLVLIFILVPMLINVFQSSTSGREISYTRFQ
ncbi:MAG: hypothetical protein KAU31_11305, partial [Spirochaetaceae bacterium]|nr:hypothetical protein [Spirochaetaceae bacterium]